MTTDTAAEPIGYMERTRLYYRALGYDKDYVWATFDDVPFARLKTPLSEARVALVTTSLPKPPEGEQMGGKRVWSLGVDELPEVVATAHVSWDKESTHTRDRESFIPIGAIAALADESKVGGVSKRVHGVPTTYSQKRTMQKDAPEIWRRIKEDGADAVMLLPL